MRSEPRDIAVLALAWILIITCIALVAVWGNPDWADLAEQPGLPAASASKKKAEAALAAVPEATGSNGPPAIAEAVSLPDADFVYGPGEAAFDIQGFVQGKAGALSAYRETVQNAGQLSGAQLVEQVAREYSVSPRLLLALLEYRNGMVTLGEPARRAQTPFINDPRRPGLYAQLAWAANELNRGFYLQRVGGIQSYHLADGADIPLPGSASASIVGLGSMLAQILGRDEWEQAMSSAGVMSTYAGLFGGLPHSSPSAIQTQPAMQLPFQDGVEWVFTGGPHAAWDTGSAWGALDFAPLHSSQGCGASREWAVAVADGVVTRSAGGAVVLDLDGDGNEATGWTVLYFHMFTQERAAVGTHLKAGDPVGHPSCEGGVSTGTHMHLARKYNGEWIPADQNLPFNLGGWISAGRGVEYQGTLSKGGVVATASTGTATQNVLSR